jgi:teichuronic acid biosynthesis glycosyltransferase TuaG
VTNLVSIITPSFGSARFISKTIESVINQNYENWEMIIVDDVSPDSSNEIIERYSRNDSRIRLIKLKVNAGPAEARNRAIKEASGRYIAFLDADDLWAEDKLEKQLKFMSINNVEISYTAFQMINEEASEKVGAFTSVPERVSYEDILKTCHIFCSSVVYDTIHLGKLYMPNIRKRQDFALWLKILKRVRFAYGVDEVLMFYRIREDSVSSNKLKASLYQWMVYRDVEKLPLIKATYYFICYAYFGLKKYRGKKN